MPLRGPSIFDRRHSINAHWLYELPFGHSGTWTDKVAGGWSIAGTYTWFSGGPLCVDDSGNFGGSSGFNATCGFSTGPVPSTSSVHLGVFGSNDVGTNADPANKGSGMNIFNDPEAVFNSFRVQQFGVDRRTGRGILRGLGHWDTSISLHKKTPVTEQVSISLGFDFLNIFNNPQFNDPGINLNSSKGFGVITSQFNEPRVIQVSLRVDF